MLLIDRALCEAKVTFQFQEEGMFSGDQEVADGTTVSGFATSYPEALKANLYVGGSDQFEIQEATCARSWVTMFGTPGPCANIGGPWMSDLVTLSVCGALDTNCKYPASIDLGPATFSWSFKPTCKQLSASDRKKLKLTAGCQAVRRSK